MKFPFSFNFSNSFLYLIFYSLSSLMQTIIMNEYKEINQSQIFKMFMMYISESLSIIFYLREKKKLNDKSLDECLFNVKSNYKIKIYFVIFWCTSLDLIGSIYYDSVYSYDMNKINKEVLQYMNNTFLGFFIYINESFYLNIETYLHQKLGIYLNFICLFVITFIHMII